MWGGIDKYQTCLTCEKLEGGGEEIILYTYLNAIKCSTSSALRKSSM